MKITRRMIGILLLLASGYLATGGKLPSPAPAPGPSVPAIEVPAQVKSTLEAGFTGKASEASIWSGLMYGLARTVEQDAGHPEGARLRTMVDVERLRDWVVKCPPVPVAGGETIGQALGPELAKLGTSTEELAKDGRRAAIVKLLDGAGQTLEGLAK